MSKRIKNIAILGGSGFVGTNVAIECLKRGYDPLVIDTLIREGSEENSFKLEALGIKVLRNDIRNVHDLSLDAIKEADAIIHLAGNVGIRVSIDNPYYDFTQNTMSTLNVLELARLFRIPVIFASTNKVYSDAVNEVPLIEGKTRYGYKDIKGIDESFRTDGAHHTPYGMSKLAADLYCQEYFTTFGVQTVVNRMSCIYGLHQNGAEDQGWVDHFVRQNMFDAGNVNIYGDGKQVRDVLFGEDVAKLYLDELENIDKCAGQAFNIGGGPQNTLSLLECMRLIEEQTDKHFDVTYHDWRPADQKCYISNIDKITGLIGWRPTVTPEEGIARMIKEYATN